MKKQKSKKKKPQPSEKPRYCAVIVAKNEQENLPGVLNALKRQTIPPYKIILVDDGSTDSTTNLAEKNGCIVVRFPDRGYNATPYPEFSDNREVGARMALGHGADWVLMVDADTILPPEYVERLIRVFHSNPSIGVASGLAKNEKQVSRFPRGAGRMYRSRALLELLRKRGFIFDRVFGGDDTEIVYALTSLGYSYTIVKDLYFILLRETTTLRLNRLTPSKILTWLSVLQTPKILGGPIARLLTGRNYVTYKPWCWYSAKEYIKDKIGVVLFGKK